MNAVDSLPSNASRIWLPQLAAELALLLLAATILLRDTTPRLMDPPPPEFES